MPGYYQGRDKWPVSRTTKLRYKLEERDESLSDAKKCYVVFDEGNDITLYYRNKGSKVKNRWTVDLTKAWYGVESKANQIGIACSKSIMRGRGMKGTLYSQKRFRVIGHQDALDRFELNCSLSHELSPVTKL